MNAENIKNELQELINKQDEANFTYGMGAPIMTDPDYDKLCSDIVKLQDKLSELDPNSKLVTYDPNAIGFEIPDDDERKEKLPIKMASMEKEHSLEEIIAWVEKKNIPLDTPVVLSPKYDGAAFCSDEESYDGWTRGDGVLGQKSTAHYAKTGEAFEKPLPIYSFGEMIIPRKTFIDKYSVDAYIREEELGEIDLEEIFGDKEGYANARNTVGGKLKKSEPSEILKDFRLMRFGMEYKDGRETPSKSEQLTRLNKMNKIQVPFKQVKISELNDDYLLELFREWNVEFELDGLIIDIDDPVLVKNLGRNGKGNPEYARAYKNPLFCDMEDTVVIEIKRSLSKKGLMVPVVWVQPIGLNGVTVIKATGINERHIRRMGIAVGETVTMMRGGMVIPKIIAVGGVDVPDPKDKEGIKLATKLRAHVDIKSPTHCYSCGEEHVWGEGKVDIICENPECPEQQLERVVAFFILMGIENMGEGNVKAFFNHGFDTVKKILNMTQDEMETVDRFGRKKSKLIHTSIHKRLKEVELPKVQHASSLFARLGSRKLALVEGMEKATLDELSEVSGFAKKSAESYLFGLSKFDEFMEGLPITLAVKQAPTSDKFKDQNIVFTGYRNKDWEAIIKAGGGKIGSGVSSKTTLLVIGQKGSGSGKEVKAESLGIEILEPSEFEKRL